MVDDILAVVISVVKKDLMTSSPISAGDSFASLGMDSLDLMETMLDLEEAFPEANLHTYEPSMRTTLEEIAKEIDWRKAGK